MRIKKWSEIIGKDYHEENEQEFDLLSTIIQDYSSGKVRTRKVADGAEVVPAREFGECSELELLIRRGVLPIDNVLFYRTTPEGYERMDLKDISEKESLKEALSEVSAIVVYTDDLDLKGLYEVKDKTYYVFLKVKPYGSGYSGFQDIAKAVFNRLLKQSIDWM